MFSVIRRRVPPGGAWSSDILPTNLGFKLGSRHVYTLLGGGIGRSDRRQRALFGIHAGLGVHTTPARKLSGDRLFLDIDAITSQFATSDEWDEQDATFSSLRVTGGWHLIRYFALTAGLTYNVNVRKADSTFERPGLDWLVHTAALGRQRDPPVPRLPAGAADRRVSARAEARPPCAVGPRAGRPPPSGRPAAIPGPSDWWLARAARR